MNKLITFRYPNIYQAWLVCLFAVLTKIRKEGLFSIEGDVESPEDGQVFPLFPQTLSNPYCEFATDQLRLMVGGNINPAELKIYADHYIAGLVAPRKTGSPESVDESLLRTISLSLWTAVSGYAPQVAVEFGRQCVPVEFKPSNIELECLLKEYKAAVYKNAKKFEEDRNETIAKFVASLN